MDYLWWCGYRAAVQRPDLPTLYFIVICKHICEDVFYTREKKTRTCKDIFTTLRQEVVCICVSTPHAAPNV